ncbi:MAG: S1 RNA-binding domain-containing protein, partial [Chloroflexota bacterium]
MTEEEQGGTTPPAEATAPAPAPEQTDAAPVAADDPANTVVVETTEAAADPAPEPEAAPEAVTDPEPAGADAVEVAPDPEASVPAETPDETAPEAETAASAEIPETVQSNDAAPEASPDVDGAADQDAASDTASPVDDDELADAPAAESDPIPARELGPEPTTMEELLAEQDSDIKSFKHGDVVDGTVVRIDKDEILVDIGAKSEGVVSNRELFGRGGESQPALAIGDTVLVYVLQPESPEGHVVLSLRRAGLERKWRSMQEQLEAGVIIEAPVIDHNKGGLIVDCGIRGFVPISQIVDFPRRPQNDQPRDAAQEIAEKLMPFVGRKLRLKILEVNRKANRLILSEKVALYEERREKRDELFSSLQVGQKVT